MSGSEMGELVMSESVMGELVTSGSEMGELVMSESVMGELAGVHLRACRRISDG